MLIQHAIFGFAALCCGPVAFYGRPYVVMERSLYFAAVVSVFFSFFLAYSQRLEIGRLPYFQHDVALLRI